MPISHVDINLLSSELQYEDRYQTFPTFERAIFVIGFKIGYYSILLNNSIKLQKNT